MTLNMEKKEFKFCNLEADKMLKITDENRKNVKSVFKGLS